MSGTLLPTGARAPRPVITTLREICIALLTAYCLDFRAWVINSLYTRLSQISSKQLHAAHYIFQLEDLRIVGDALDEAGEDLARAHFYEGVGPAFEHLAHGSDPGNGFA